MILLWLLLVAPATAQEGATQLTGVWLVPDLKLASPNATSFHWPQVLSLDAVLRVEHAGRADARADLLATVRSQSGALLVKRKADFRLTPGRNELRMDDFIATTDVVGRRLLRLIVELAVQDGGTLQRELEFSLTGPPQPTATISELRLYDPLAVEGRLDAPGLLTPREQFEVGDSFGVEAVVDIGENPAGLEPRVRIMAVMDGEEGDTGFELPRQYYTAHFDERRLDRIDEPLRIRAAARLPHFFIEPWASRHGFTVRVEVLFDASTIGVEPAARADVRGEVYDYRPGDQRRNDYAEQRLINLARAPMWIVLPAAAPVPDRGLYQPPF